MQGLTGSGAPAWILARGSVPGAGMEAGAPASMTGAWQRNKRGLREIQEKGEDVEEKEQGMASSSCWCSTSRCAGAALLVRRLNSGEVRWSWTRRRLARSGAPLLIELVDEGVERSGSGSRGGARGLGSRGGGGCGWSAAQIQGDGRRRERIWIWCGFGWSDAENKGRREAGCGLGSRGGFGGVAAAAGWNGIDGLDR